ncbi:HEAT repeat domain-containing protein [Streptomyces sp. NPDC003032]
MFKTRRDRRQAELAELLRDPDAAVRAGAAAEAAETADVEWALRELAQAVAREPYTESFHESVADGFAAALRREAAVRDRTERTFAEHLDDPEGLVRAWTGLVAELGGPPAVRDVGEDLRDDMRERLTYLRGEGWTAEGIAGLGRPGGFARDLAFDLAVIVASLVVRRNEPLPVEEAERIRTGTRAALAEALLRPPGDKERSDILVDLTQHPEDEAWTDRARLGLLFDEALALCADEDPDRRKLGVETLSDLLLFNGVFRPARVGETLAELAAEPLDAASLSELLHCYDVLHVGDPLEDPPLRLFLDGLRHSDARVRAAAAEGLNPMVEGTALEGEAVSALVGLLEHDTDDKVRVTAARTLSGLDYAGKSEARAAADALERAADSPVPEVRAFSLRDALEYGAPDAFDRLLRELESPDVHWAFLTHCTAVSLYDGFRLPDGIRPRLVERLRRLEASGWADRCEDAEDYPDPEDRAEMLSTLLERLRDS